MTSLAHIVALCKRRGIIWPTSEIYGGLGAAYEYGHYGVLLKENVKAAWRQAVVHGRDDVVMLDSAIIQHPQTWEASGHLAKFADPMVDCATCGKSFRADALEDAACTAKPSKRPGQGPACQLGEQKDFNLMFSTQLGATGDTRAYLRPETAQGIFVNFDTIAKANNLRPPFGIAQIGKSFRNEITARQFTFRMREFEQMEMEYFVHPDDADFFYDFWRQERLDWYVRMGIRPENLRLREHDADERAHYSTATADVEYRYPIGWREVEGIAHRGDYDLSAHTAASGKQLVARDSDNVPYTPYVIEPAAGLDRVVLALLCDAYAEEELESGTRTVLRLHPRVAPVTASVIALDKRGEMPDIARKIGTQLKESIVAEVDVSGKFARAYRRADEIGTPWCVTVDHQTLVDGTVTLRDRDTLAQERIPTHEIAGEIARRRAVTWTPAR